MEKGKCSTMSPSKDKPPRIGELIYLPTSLYIDHGEDDFRGGLCEVCRVERSISAFQDTWFVVVKERPGYSLNWEILAENQEKYASEYGTRRGFCDSDPIEVADIRIGSSTVRVVINDLRLVIASIPEETRQRIKPLVDLYGADVEDAQRLFNSDLFPLLMGILPRFDATIEEVLKRKNYPV